jgi:DNA repair photolyase
MIISASRRTDIPAFYAEWFMKRVRAGYFYRVNPFNSTQVTGFSLKAEDVDAICFWTKNPQPLMKHLHELDERGLNYYFQFTLNPYDKIFEPGVPPLQERIDSMIELTTRIGAERVVWRYDPVILSSATPVSWHLEQAERIAGKIRHATRRLVFSFYDYYGKGQGRLSTALAGTAIKLEDIAAPEQSGALEQIARGFKGVADRHNLQIFTCSEKVDLAAIGIHHGACIDGDLIRELSGITAPLKMDKNQRAACNCIESVDMGMYNSCRYRCSYCYANFNEGVIESNCRKHIPDSPSLLDEYGGDIEIRGEIYHNNKNCKGYQQNLF